MPHLIVLSLTDLNIHFMIMVLLCLFDLFHLKIPPILVY